MEIPALKNLGPVSTEWLHAVGIYTLADLENIGSVETFRLIQLHGFNASLNLLYALEGALRGEHWNQLSPQVKEKLKRAAKGL